MDFESIQIQDIEKTLDYVKARGENNTEVILYDHIYTELLRIDPKVMKKNTQNFITDDAYYCIRTNYLEGLAFGGIPKEILEDRSKPLFLILFTNKNGQEIKIDTYNNGNRPKDTSISYKEDGWKELRSGSTDIIANRIVELLRNTNG